MKGFKFIVAVTFLISVGSLTGNFFLHQRVKTEQAAREQLESQKVQLEERSSQLEARVAKANQYQQEAESLRSQIKGYVNQRDSARKELDQAYKEANDLRKKMKELESEKGVLTERATVDEVREKAIVDEAVKLPSTPPSVATLVSPIVTPAAAKPSKQKALEKPQKNTETPSGQSAVTDQRPHQVLSVNRQFKFVVVNIGLRNQIKIGDTLRVEEGGKLVGRIKVEKLYENFSACSIVEEIQPNKIQEGDLVRLS